MTLRIRYYLTRAYLKYFGKFIKCINYGCYGIQEKVYIFSSKEKKYAHTTPFKTIIMQDIIFKKNPKDVQDFIFLHEMGHIRLNWFVSLLFYLIAVPSLFAFFVTLPFIIVGPAVFFALGMKISFVITAFITYLLLFLFISLFVLIPNWLIEGHADIFAIRRIGVRKYESICKRLEKEHKKKKLFARYFYRVRYPPFRWVVWFYSKYIKK